MIPLTLLTYKRSDYFKRTLETFLNVNKELLPFLSIIVVIQGEPEPLTIETIAKHSKHIHKIIYKENEGIGPGFCFCMRENLKYNAPFVFHIEDDWRSVEPIAPHMDQIKYLFRSFPNVGYLRLRDIHSIVCMKNRHRENISPHPRSFLISRNISITNLGWSWNPGIFRSSMIKKLIPVDHEKHAAKKYGEFGFDTARLIANCFSHIGRESAKDIWREEKKKNEIDE